MAGDMTAQEIRLILRMKKHDIVDLLIHTSPIAFRNSLNQWNIISYEDLCRLQQHLDRVQSEGGAFVEYQQYLLDVVLSNSDEAILKFLEFIENVSNQATEIYELIQRNKGRLKKIGEHIKQIYQKINYNLVQTIPGEDFHLDLTKSEYLMPMTFHIEKLEIHTRQSDVLPSKKVKHKFKSVQLSSIIDVIQNLHGSEDSSIMCLGIAGSGKSIMVKNILCSWLMSDLQMQGFHIVMVIPLRDVNVNKPLVEILKQVGNSNHMHMITDEVKSDLEYLLLEPSGDVLLLFDGIDEVEIAQESDLYKMLTGEKYGNIKKVFTARPEAKLLSTLDTEHVYQHYQVHFKGTTSDGIKHYLRAIIKSSNSNTKANADAVDKSVEEIIEKCRQEMEEYALLHIPLYLTLMGYLFNKHYVEYCSFANFEVPRSATNLYNACMKVLLRIWLKRLNRLDEFTFANNPLAITSTVPNDIKRQLYMIGKVSYDFLTDKKYSFSGADLSAYYISEGDVMVSGLFDVSQNVGTFNCFFSHRTLQEYMAALYLSQVQFGEYSFTRIVETSLNKQNILSLFPNLVTVIRFVFGIDPLFASKIIKRLGPHIGITMFTDDLDNFDMKSESDDSNENDKHDNYQQEYVGDRIDLTYEAALFSEIDDPQLKNTFLDFLSTCSTIETGCPYDKNIDQIFLLCKGFSKVQRIQILKQWFDLEVEVDNGCSLISNLMKVNDLKSMVGTHILPTSLSSAPMPVYKQVFVYDHQQLIESYSQPIDTDSSDPGGDVDFMDDEPCQEQLKNNLHIQEFWSILYCLLSPLCFPNILSLEINKSHISNVNLILRIFPNIKYLSVSDIDVSYINIEYGRDEEMLGALLRHGTHDNRWPFEDEQADPLMRDLLASYTHSTSSVMPTNLTHVILKANHEALSEKGINALTHQKQLESLIISEMDIFYKARDIQRYEHSWKLLNNLEIFMNQLEPHHIEHIYSLVGRKIKYLTLGTSIINRESLTMFPNNILDHLTKDPPLELKMLRLFNVLNDEGITKLCDLLPNLIALETLGLSSEDVSDLGNFADVVKQCHCINRIHVGYLQHARYPEEENPITVARNLAATLAGANNTNLGIKVEMYEYREFEIKNLSEEV